MPPPQLLRVKLVFSNTDLLRLPASSPPYENIFLSNVPDYVNPLNCLTLKSLRSSCKHWLLFDAVCTLPVWTNPALRDPVKAHRIYAWTHGRLTAERSAALGWEVRSELSSGMEMYWAPVAHRCVACDDWLLFLEELFLLIAYPPPRKQAFLDVVPALTFASLAAVVRAAEATPAHWCESLVAAVISGKLETSAVPALCVPELPPAVPARSRRAVEYDVRAFSLEFEYLFRVDAAALATYLSPFLAPSCRSHPHRRDVRCFLLHPRDVKSFRGVLQEDAGMFSMLAEQFGYGDDAGRPFVSKALAACSERVVALSACARITDAHVLELTMRFAALAALNYVALLAHGTYGSFVDEVPLARMKQLQEIHI
jgi:hypothetical protein